MAKPTKIDAHFQGMKRQKPQNWNILEKEGSPNVAKYVTGAYFGLLKICSLFFASLFEKKT